MKFTETHEWVTTEGEVATVGVSNYAQKELGDIVYVELPRIGSYVEAGEELIVLESTKAAVDVYAPISGKIIAVNETLKQHPEKINQSPESEGWLVKLELSHPEQVGTLLDKAAYEKLLK